MIVFSNIFPFVVSREWKCLPVIYNTYLQRCQLSTQSQPNTEESSKYKYTYICTYKLILDILFF